MSGLVINSGYIPFVMRKMLCRKTASVQPNRRAISGRYHTGSMAALLTMDWPLGNRTFPSGMSLPAAIASLVSGKSM